MKTIFSVIILIFFLNKWIHSEEAKPPNSSSKIPAQNSTLYVAKKSMILGPSFIDAAEKMDDDEDEKEYFSTHPQLPVSRRGHGGHGGHGHIDYGNYHNPTPILSAGGLPSPSQNSEKNEKILKKNVDDQPVHSTRRPFPYHVDTDNVDDNWRMPRAALAVAHNGHDHYPPKNDDDHDHGDDDEDRHHRKIEKRREPPRQYFRIPAPPPPLAYQNQRPQSSPIPQNFGPTPIQYGQFPPYNFQPAAPPPPQRPIFLAQRPPQQIPPPVFNRYDPQLVQNGRDHYGDGHDHQHSNIPPPPPPPNQPMPMPVNVPLLPSKMIENPPRNFDEVYTGGGFPKIRTTSGGDVDCGFKCLSDGKCLSANWRCDGYAHCSDASDESHCTCLDRIEAKKICDGIADCNLEEDEMGCHGCTPQQFSCKDPLDDYENKEKLPGCIDLAKRCDGRGDCPKNVDERQCYRLGSIKKDIRGVLSEGLLQKNIGGTWYTICKKLESDFTLSTIAKKVCGLIVGDLGTDDPVVTSTPATGPDFVGLPFAFIGDSDSAFVISTKGTCPSKQVYSIKCPDPPCGWPVSKFDNGGPAAGIYSRHSHTSRSKRSRYSAAGAGNDEIMGKVVGGYDSKLGEWPFLGAIYRNGSFHCGCSIIDKEWILTAGHCTHNFDRWVYEVQVGMMRRYSFSYVEQTRMVTQVHTHVKYDKHIFLNDISLMKLDSPLFLSKWVTTACLSYDKTADPTMDQMCHVIGWGDLAEDGTSPDNLQEVSLPVKPCRETFTREAVQICAGYDEGGKDACQGDSGGPFICKDFYGRYVVHGIVSFGRGCARPGQLGVYTRISAFTSWIDSIVSGSSSVYKSDNFYSRPCPGDRCHRSGGECIFPKMRCDRTVDCIENDDELDCDYVDNENPADQSYQFDAKAAEAVKAAKHVHEEHTHGEEGGPKLCDESSEFQCKITKSCVALEKRCNVELDCSDHTDEKDCPCGTKIGNAFPAKKCDAFCDCGGECGDEENCEFCPGQQETHVKCPLTPSQCIEKSKWCDGMLQCPSGEDEVDCFRIIRDKAEIPKEGLGFLDDKKSRGTISGYVFIRQEGIEWTPVCEEEWGQNLEDLVCPYLSLGTPSLSTDDVYADGDDYPKPAYKRQTPHRYIERKLPVGKTNENWRGRSLEKDAEKSCQNHSKVVCGEAECGVRRLYSYANSPPQNALGIGVHPWLAQIFVDGEPKCLATLISKKWAISSTRCVQENFRNLKDFYVSIRAGPYHYPFVELSSPMEQVKRVNYIGHHDDDENDGLSFLHLDTSINSDHFVSPLCTDFGRETGGGAMWNFVFRECIRMGHKEGRTEVKFGSIQVKMNGCSGGRFCAILDEKECTETANSFVYCTTDTAAVTSWYFIGLVRPGGVSGGCSKKFQNEVQILNPFLDNLVNGDAQKYQNLINGPPPTVTSPPLCPGTRCPYGNCVSKDYVCDGVNDCGDGQDESRCQRHYQIFRASGDEEDMGDNHNSQNLNLTCPSGHFRCASTYNCVPINSFCDGLYDCGMDDLTDEPEGHCDCRTYFGLIAPENVCDTHGALNCPDRSDEHDCPCQLGSFNCDEYGKTANTCIHPLLVCDGLKDCGNGRDEEGCVALSTDLHTLTENRTTDFTTGFVLLRVKDGWHPYCSNDWSKELAAAICKKELGYRKLVDMKLFELDEINRIQQQASTGVGASKTKYGHDDDEEEGGGNLLILQKDEDLFGKYDYKKDDGGVDVNFEECYVALITCSNDRKLVY